MWNGLMSFVQRCHARVLTFELKSEDGQAMVEYGLIVALVSVVAVVALAAIGVHVNTAFTTVKEALEKA